MSNNEMIEISTRKGPVWRVVIAALVIVLLTVLYVRQSAFSESSAKSLSVTNHAAKAPAGDEIATLAGGCFWSMQAMFSQLKGVDDVEAGYAGGTTPNPTYEDVCTESTGYVETIQVTFNPKVITYRELLNVYFHVINPTTKDRQGDDVGSSYRSVVFYHGDQQKAIADEVIQSIDKAHVWPNPIVTELAPYRAFHQGEAYHQDYYVHNPTTPYCQFVVAPKVAKLREEFGARLK